MDGTVSVSKVLYSRLPNNSVFYVKITANVTQHPLSGDLVVFITEESNNPEKLASTINGKILAKQFDLVAYIARDIYDVAIGDASMIEHGNIFPEGQARLLPGVSGNADHSRPAQGRSLSPENPGGHGPEDRF